MKNYSKILCWGCDKEYRLDNFGLQQVGVSCDNCDGVVISNSGKVKFQMYQPDAK